MFGRLKEHAKTVDAKLQALEKNLEHRLKPIFSITEYDISESSIKYFEELISDLSEIDNNTQQMIERSQELNRKAENEYKANLDSVKVIEENINSMENHLEKFGYVRDTSNTNSFNGNTMENSVYNENTDNENSVTDESI